jgi:hypothetical protein
VRLAAALAVIAACAGAALYVHQHRVDVRAAVPGLCTSQGVKVTVREHACELPL